jgi:hypothetical protein
MSDDICKEANPCPRCGSKMTWGEAGGGRLSFPMVILGCANKGCLWNMTCYYDDLSGQSADDLKKRMVEEWNEGTTPKT